MCGEEGVGGGDRRVVRRWEDGGAVDDGGDDGEADEDEADDGVDGEAEDDDGDGDEDGNDGDVDAEDVGVWIDLVERRVGVWNVDEVFVVDGVGAEIGVDEGFVDG